MLHLKVPPEVNRHRFDYDPGTVTETEMFARIKSGLTKYNQSNPEVSVVIPAYNEEKGILHTLSSLAAMKNSKKTELIVVDNNSSDRTGYLLSELGVRVVKEPRQGISYAREAGLSAAKGSYLLSADADAIYPESWVDAMVGGLQNPEVTCVYGSYSFLDEGTATRPKLALYEIVARRFLNLRTARKPYLNVMGFNSAYRVKDAIMVGGYRHERLIWEDGRIAMELMNYGQVRHLKSGEATVWTGPRRILMDGGLGRGFIIRVKKEIKNLHEFVF